MKPAVRVTLVIAFVVIAIIAWRVLPASRTVADPVAVDAAAILRAQSDVTQVPSSLPDSVPVVTNYRCGDSAAEFTLQSENTAVLDVAGDVYHLARSVSASGVKYETAPGLTPRALFWTKDDAALLEVSGTDDRTCTAIIEPPMPTAQNGEITQLEWQAIEMRQRPLPAGVAITLMLDDAGRIAGSSGCNRYTGPYALDTAARSLTISGPVAGTRMACAAPGAMAAEEHFNALLPTITAYQIEDGPVLVIYAGSDDVLRLSPASAQ